MSSESGNKTSSDLDGVCPESASSAPSSSLLGYLPWEQDLQMVSAFIDKKVYT